MDVIKKNILTIDCEDFLSLPAFKNIKPSFDWDKLINKQVNLVLDTLYSANDTKATFFVVGEIARRNPHLIKRIEEKGHHIGSHSNVHLPINKLSKSEFASDLEKSLYYLNGAMRKEVNCYRAPIWSYKKEMVWFWDVLKQNKIIYDSSIFPISKYLFGNPKEKRFINQKQSGIIELPPSTFKIFGFNFPFSGGIYFRFLPYFFIKLIIKKSCKKYKQPIVMYFHPWELDPNLIKVKQITNFYKFILYFNTKKSLNKFSKLLNEFHFTSIDRFFESQKL